MSIIKTKREIELLKKSAEITDSCIPIIKQSLKEDKITEKELRRIIERKIRSQSANLSFQTLVACGKRSAMIHPKPNATNKIISGIGYVDFGASYKGYKADITVPFIKGKIGKRERKIVETTLEAYNLAISSITINNPCWELFQEVSNFLRENGFELKHGLGHGLGLKIHEQPFISMPRKKRLIGKKKRRWEKIKKINFQENMVFTIEPAVYVKGIGGCRLENDIALTERGLKVLTHAKLIEIK